MDYSSNKIMEWVKFIDMKITSSFLNQLIFFFITKHVFQIITEQTLLVYGFFFFGCHIM